MREIQRTEPETVPDGQTYGMEPDGLPGINKGNIRGCDIEPDIHLPLDVGRLGDRIAYPR